MGRHHKNNSRQDLVNRGGGATRRDFESIELDDVHSGRNTDTVRRLPLEDIAYRLPSNNIDPAEVAMTLATGSDSDVITTTMERPSTSGHVTTSNVHRNQSIRDATLRSIREKRRYEKNPECDEEELFYQVLSASRGDMTEDEINETLHSASHSLTVKRRVLLRLRKDDAQSIESRSRRSSTGARLSCCKRFRYLLLMMMQRSQQNLVDALTGSDLWHGSLKRIQGHFGSGVTAYFKFHRWLFLLNFGMLGLVFSLIIMPQMLYNHLTNRDYHAGFHNGTEHSLFLELPYAIITGSGMFNNSILFHGHYTNETLTTPNYSARYDIPLAYYITVTICLTASLIAVGSSLARSYRINYAESSVSSREIQAFRVFSAWDFGIESESAARLMSKTIYTELKEMVHKFEKPDTGWGEVPVQIESAAACGRFMGRLFINVGIFGAIAGSCLAVWKLLENTQPLDSLGGSEFFIEMRLALLISLINYFLPLLFIRMSKFEFYDSKQIYVYANLTRATVLRLSVLGVVVSSYLLKHDTCNWETHLGQEIYRLFVVSHLMTLIISMVLSGATRYLIQRYVKWIGHPEFDIAQNTFELVYAQTLIWLGLYFCPLLPIIGTVVLWIMFYLKRITLLCWCEPSVEPWKAHQANTLFQSLCLISSIMCNVAVAYTSYCIKPSETFGPFRGYNSSYEFISERLFPGSNESHQWRKVVSYLFAPFAIFLYLLLLCLVTYWARAIAMAHVAMVKLLEQQLESQARDRALLLRWYRNIKRDKPIAANKNGLRYRGGGASAAANEPLAAVTATTSTRKVPGHSREPSYTSRELHKISDNNGACGRSGTGAPEVGSGLESRRGSVRSAFRELAAHQPGFQYSRGNTPRPSVVSLGGYHQGHPSLSSLDYSSRDPPRQHHRRL